MKHSLLRHWIAIATTAAMLAACGGGSAGGSSSNSAVVNSGGTVVDDQGIPLSGVTIKVIAASAGTASTSTANDGKFSIPLSSSTAAVIRVEKAGFMPMVRAAGDAASNAAFAARVVLLPVASTQTFDSTQSAVLRVPGSSARVELAASSLARTDGQAISGSATVQLTPIDPSKDISFMPGVMVDSNSGTPIESLGALSVNFTDATGAPLNLASGQTATIRIPATPAAGATLPATFPLYHLNETTGLWVQEGTATLQTDSVTGDKYYEGTVSHFSTWNADVEIIRATIRMADGTGAACPIPEGFQLRVLGLDYNGGLFTRTTSGDVTVKAGALVRVFLMNASMEIVDSLDMTAPAVGDVATIPRCLALQPKVTVSGTVSVTSGSLTNYHLVIVGERLVKRSVPIAADGSYSVQAFVNSGYIEVQLKHATFRGTPDTKVSATVAATDITMPVLNVADTTFSLSGCVQGWAGFRQDRATVSLFRGSTLVGTPNLVSSTSTSFNFSDVAFNTTYSLRLTTPDATLTEKSTPLVVGSTPVALGSCLSLPIPPQAAATASGTGFDRSFDASTSVAGDAALSTYAWDFGDGTTGTGISPSHTYASVGSYSATLVVTDALGQKSNRASLTVVVTNGGTISTSGDQIAVGVLGGCAINAGGGVECWSDVPSSKAAVPGLSSNVVAITAGAGHYCAMTSVGALKCWGSNAYGQLGNGSTTYSSTPVNVSGLSSGVQAVSAGANHTCAITSSGGVKCWGYGGFLGNGGTANSAIPVDVTGLTGGTVAIAAGGGDSSGHTCAATSGAGVFCWGNGGSGQLGHGDTASSLVPVSVSGLAESVTALSAGADHSCALTSAGAVKCWGGNSSGQLGDNSDTSSSTPVVVGTRSSVTALNSGTLAISGHFSHTCAIGSDGAVWCWGLSTYGQIDRSSESDQTYYYPVTNDVQTGSAIGVGTGKYATCILRADRSVQCWGWDQSYEPGG